jgi:hypothetical protein
MKEEQIAAFVASVRTRLGQIKKANNNPTADSWGQIELACDKLKAEADTFDRTSRRSP